MDFHTPTLEQLQLGQGAMRTIASRPDDLTVNERAMLSGVQRAFGAEFDLDALEPIAPQELAQSFASAAEGFRIQFLHAMCVFAAINTDVRVEAVDAIERFRDALGVQSPYVQVMRDIAEGHTIRMRAHLMPRFWAVDHLRHRIRKQGVGVLFRFLGSIFGGYKDDEVARRFAELKDYPAGSLGREYYRYLEDNGFPPPGTPGSAFDIIVYHDLAHVIGAYDTTPSEEVQVASFSAGFRSRDPYAFVFFVLAQFHLGIRVAPGAKAEKGFFDAEKVVAALKRGSEMSKDLSDYDWDYWKDLKRPLAELRKEWRVHVRDSNRTDDADWR